MPEFSYSGDPSKSPKDAIRYLLGDTDSTDPILFDEEIQYELSAGRNILITASVAAESIAAKFTRKVDKQLGANLRISYAQKSKQFRQLAADLRRRAAMTGSASPWAGGIFVDDKQNRELDNNRTAPAFTRNLHDVPGREDTQTPTETRTLPA